MTATGKNSACEAFGHFQVSEPANLANYELLHVRQSWLLDIQY